MRAEHDTNLAALTTLRVGGPARQLVEVESEAELISAVRECDARGEPVLTLGGGSNLVVGDAGFDGTVVRIVTRGISVDTSACEADGLAACGGVIVTVAAGEPWDDVVQQAVAEEWYGIEALSGIPGLVGATPMQNVGAYGQDVSQTLWNLRVYDRERDRVRTFANADCQFGYRTSRFKGSDRFVVLDVSYQFRQGALSAPIAYPELAARLNIDVGERAALADVREAVLQLRRGKAMVLDAADHDTWSAGSFFTNPVLPAADAAQLPDGVPRWPMPDDHVKVSAAWLIEHAGFGRGYAAAGGRVGLSSKHTLALTNRGDAAASDVLKLAREIRDGVRDSFGVGLQPEPTLVGCSL